MTTEEIDRERQVVLQEISQAEDTPDDFIHDLFNLKFWEGHPLALPIFGSVETVNAINRELLVSFMADRYRAGRVFIAAAGMVDHERLVDDCARLFGGVSGDGHGEPIAPPADRTVVINQEKELEQTHICIGGPGISQASPLRYASYVLNTALGGGMSSRLFQEVREHRGRVYSIYSFMSSFLDCGYLGIYAGTNPEWVEEVLEVTLGEVNKIARVGLTDEELARAKSQLKGNMLLGMESTESRMNRARAQRDLLSAARFRSRSWRREIDKVTHDQVLELAADLVSVRQDGAGAAGRFEGAQVRPRSLLRAKISLLRAKVDLSPRSSEPCIIAAARLFTAPERFDFLWSS